MDEKIMQAFTAWAARWDNPIRIMSDEDHPLPAAFGAGYQAATAAQSAQVAAQAARIADLEGDVQEWHEAHRGLQIKGDAQAAEIERLNGIIAAAPVQAQGALTDAQLKALWGAQLVKQTFDFDADAIAFAKAAIAQSAAQGVDDARDAERWRKAVKMAEANEDGDGDAFVAYVDAALTKDAK